MKITRKGLVRKLDKLAGDIVKLRDGACVCCGTKLNLTPGHLFTRQVYATRWDLNNLFAQCMGCNLRHEHDPYPLTNYYLNKFGKKSYDELHKVFFRPVPVKTWQLSILLENLQTIYKDLLEQNKNEKNNLKS